MQHGNTTHLVGAWLPPHGDVVAVNGVYFDEHGIPTGYVVTGGKRIGTHAFDDARTAAVRLTPTPMLVSRTRDIGRDGFQTYPLLVRKGIIVPDEDTRQYARRTFFGVDANGQFYVGVLPDAAVSLYEFAQALVHMGIAWDFAVNLDGGTSTGLAARVGTFQETLDSLVAVPHVLLITPRMDNP